MTAAVQWMQRHRRSILFLILMLALAGGMSAFRMPVALFPNVAFPRIVVHLDAGDRAADQMELVVTRPVELAVRAIPGVHSVRSTTSRGSADVSIDFGWGHDMARALLQVQSAISALSSQLPANTQFDVVRRDPTVFPVMAYSLTSKKPEPVKLRDFARFTLEPMLSRVDGVAKIGIQGGKQAEFRVTVDLHKLQAEGLALSDVTDAISKNNVLEAVGRLQDRDKLYLAMSDQRPATAKDIGNIVVARHNGHSVFVHDIADVHLSTVPVWRSITADHKNAVLVQVYQQPGGNTVQIAKDIRQLLARHKDLVPPGVTIHNWYDQSQLITAAAGSVRDAILIGVVLAALVLWLFLRNTKLTLMAMVVVPVVMAATVLLLKVLGMSFNIMTLGGMAAAVGLVIDDAIVMFEHIMRRLQGAGADHHGRVMRAAAEFSQPLMGSSMATIIIFVPLAFLSGVTGAFFRALSLTMASSLAVSFLVVWLAVPLIADRFLGEKEAREEKGGAMTARAHAGYRRLLPALFRQPLWLLLIVVVFVGVGWFAYRHTGTGFMPVMDEGGFILDYRTPAGTSLKETDRILGQIETILQNTPEVQTFSRRTGAQLGGGITEANEGDFFVRLKPPPRRDIWSVMDDVRQQVEKKVPGVDIEMAQLMEDLIGDLTAVPQPVQIKLFSDNQKQLKSLAPKVADAIGKIPGIVDVQDGIIAAGDALDIRVNPQAAAREGMTAREITDQTNTLLNGSVATRIQHGVKMIGVRVWVPKAVRRHVSDVGKLLIRAPDGHRFPLKRVATIKPVSGQDQITRDNLKRMVAVTARISGRDMGHTIADVKSVLHKHGLIPKSVTWQLGGLYRQQQIAFHGLMIVAAAAVSLVFLLLLYLYERFRVAIAIISAPLLASGAVFIGLWISATELNITAMMGMTMIIGITTEVGIFYFSEFVELRDTEDMDSALVEAGVNRMRPIAMTTLAAILALLPLALGIGQGAQMQQPLAIAIISGLVVQLPWVLLVVPVLYRLMMRRRGD